MSPSVTYLDGTTLNSTALTEDQFNQALQIATCQMLGIVAFSVSMELVINTNIATPVSMSNLAIGQTLTNVNIPQGTTITAVNSSTIEMSSNATATSTNNVVVADSTAFFQVRVDWQQQGQPGWGIGPNTAFVRGETSDNDFSRVRDRSGSSSGGTYTTTDIYTRTWKTYWTFYGPNANNNAKFVQSALATLDFVSFLLASSNLYINPSIAEPHRFRENFQGQWWERADLEAELNEQITETITVGIVETVPISIYDESGERENFTVSS